MTARTLLLVVIVGGVASCTSPTAPLTGWNHDVYDWAAVSSDRACNHYRAMLPLALDSDAAGQRARAAVSRIKIELERRGDYDACIG